MILGPCPWGVPGLEEQLDGIVYGSGVTGNFKTPTGCSEETSSGRMCSILVLWGAKDCFFLSRVTNLWWYLSEWEL